MDLGNWIKKNWKTLLIFVGGTILVIVILAAATGKFGWFQTPAG